VEGVQPSHLQRTSPNRGNFVVRGSECAPYKQQAVENCIFICQIKTGPPSRAMAEASFDSQMAGRPIGRIANRGSYISAERSSDQLRDQRSEARGEPKGERRVAGSFKSNQCAPRPVFLRVCRHVTSKQRSRSKKIAPRSLWSCSATASGSPAARHGGTSHPHP
jgi:hypothetical protein